MCDRKPNHRHQAHIAQSKALLISLKPYCSAQIATGFPGGGGVYKYARRILPTSEDMKPHIIIILPGSVICVMNSVDKDSRRIVWGSGDRVPGWIWWMTVIPATWGKRRWTVTPTPARRSSPAARGETG